MFDSRTPQRLKSIQAWFGSILGRGIDRNNHIKPKTPSGYNIVDEAAKYITPSATLEPWERMQIYNQQYWWRLFKTLHEHLPLATRLFGRQDFNHFLAMPYLERYPPNDWSLNTLADRFPQWVKENYHETDKGLIYDAISIDVAFQRGFFAKKHPPLQVNFTHLLKTPIYLQPSITLFDLPYDLFSFHTEVLKEADEDHYLHYSLPKLDRTPATFIIFRNTSFDMYWDRLEPNAYLVLKQFEKGATLEQACSVLSDDIIKENLMPWVNTWCANGWLVQG